MVWHVTVFHAPAVRVAWNTPIFPHRKAERLPKACLLRFLGFRNPNRERGWFCRRSFTKPSKELWRESLALVPSRLSRRKVFSASRNLSSPAIISSPNALPGLGNFFFVYFLCGDLLFDIGVFFVANLDYSASSGSLLAQLFYSLYWAPRGSSNIGSYNPFNFV